MGTCSCASYYQCNNNQNVISLDIPNRMQSKQNKTLNKQSEHTSSLCSSLCSSQPSLRNNNTSVSTSNTKQTQNTYNSVNTNSSLTKKPKQYLHQSSLIKNRNSSTSTNQNSLSSSFSSANNVCSFKHNKDDINNNDSNNMNNVVQTKQHTEPALTISKEEEEILNNKNILKVAILGGKGVGKTSFLIKVLHNKFEKLYIPTIDIEKRTKLINKEGKQYTFYFIVTPGDSIYKSNYSLYFQKANFICIFYDMSALDSFNEAKQLLFNELQDVIHTTKTHINVIGNKKDIANSKLQSNEIKTFCEENKITLYEISVKSGIGMKALMNDICNIFDSENQ